MDWSARISCGTFTLISSARRHPHKHGYRRQLQPCCRRSPPPEEANGRDPGGRRFTPGSEKAEGGNSTVLARVQPSDLPEPDSVICRPVHPTSTPLQTGGAKSNNSAAASPHVPGKFCLKPPAAFTPSPTVRASFPRPRRYLIDAKALIAAAALVRFS